MSIIGSNILAGSSGQGGAYEIEQSLRFNSADSAYLNRTPASTALLLTHPPLASLTTTASGVLLSTPAPTAPTAFI
jgi:hypothetical protein